MTPAQQDPIDSAVDALFAGDDEVAKQHLRAAVGEAQRARVSAAAAEFERKHEMNAALRDFARDHAAIAGDPAARQVADAYLAHDLRQHGYATMDAVPLDDIGRFVDRAGTAAERHLRVQTLPSTDDGEAGRSSVIERMAAARRPG